MKKLLTTIPLMLLLTLSACSEEENNTKSSEPAKTETQETAPNTSSETPSTEAPQPQQSAASSSKVSQVAIDACVTAVKNQTNEANISVRSTEFSQANSLVMIDVGANKAQWKCLVSNDGKGAEVTFMGTDGDTVEQSQQPAASSSDVSQVAVDACISAVKSQTNESDLAVMSTEFSQANSLVMIGVGSIRALWKCLVSNDGQGAEVSFAGDEGAQ